VGTSERVCILTWKGASLSAAQPSQGDGCGLPDQFHSRIANVPAGLFDVALEARSGPRGWGRPYFEDALRTHQDRFRALLCTEQQPKRVAEIVSIYGRKRL
jgi:hypothetical protein